MSSPLQEVMLLNNEGARTLMPGHSQAAFGCLRRALAILYRQETQENHQDQENPPRRAADPREDGEDAPMPMEEEPKEPAQIQRLDTVAVVALSTVTVPMPHDDSFRLYDQAFLLDDAFLSAIDSKQAQIELMTVIVMFNLALACHQHHGGGKSSKISRACYLYGMVSNLVAEGPADAGGVWWQTSCILQSLAAALDLACRNNRATCLYYEYSLQKQEQMEATKLFDSMTDRFVHFLVQQQEEVMEQLDAPMNPYLSLSGWSEMNLNMIMSALPRRSAGAA